jgi:hypothetical protein
MANPIDDGSRFDTRTEIVAALIPILAPVAYLAYALGVKWVQGAPHEAVYELSSFRTGVYAVMLGLLGATVVIARNQGYHVSAWATVGVLLAVPWLELSTTVPAVGYLSVVFVGALIATGVEFAYDRFRRGNASSLVTGIGRYGILAGFGHLAVGLGFHVHVWRFHAFDSGYGVAGIALAVLLHVVLGSILFATGALPVVLWRRERLVLPAMATVTWATWGIYGTLTSGLFFPLGDSTGLQFFGGFEPHPQYMIGITELLVVVLAVAAVEYLARTTVGRMVLGSIAG